MVYSKDIIFFIDKVIQKAYRFGAQNENGLKIMQTHRCVSQLLNYFFLVHLVKLIC